MNISSHQLNNLKMSMIADVMLSHDAEILPCGKKKELSECFTEQCGYVYLWYNIQGDKSTHITKQNINEWVAAR